MIDSLSQATPGLVGVVAFLSLGASLVGYSLWARLLSRHDIWKVAPLPLMVPVVGMGSSWLILGETLTLSQVGASAIVLVGLVVNVFGAGIVYLLRR
jgi:O-acetylserine/cysteine efflux transporter